MRFEELIARLDAAPWDRLPGAAAQASLAPRPRRMRFPGFDPKAARPAAALALVYPAGEEACLLLTIRHRDLARHGGQVSLPGGAIEAGESVEQAALREAAEEVGLDPAAVTVRGRLSPLTIPVSGFVLHPVVAVATARPVVSPDLREVERVVELALSDLLRPGAVREETIERDGVPLEVPYVDVAGAKLWGATAMVVSELLALLGTPVRGPSPS